MISKEIVPQILDLSETHTDLLKNLILFIVVEQKTHSRTF